MSELMQIMLRANLLPKPLTLNQIVDGRFLPALVKP